MKITPKIIALGALVVFLAQRKPQARPQPDPEPDEPTCPPCELGPYDQDRADEWYFVLEDLEEAMDQQLLLTNAQREEGGEQADFFEARKAVNPIFGRRISYPEWLGAASAWFVLGVPESVTECCSMTGQWEQDRLDLVADAREMITEEYWQALLSRALEVGDPEPSLASIQGPG